MVKKWTKIFVGMKSKLCQFYKKEKLSLGWLLWDEVKIYNKSTIILNLSQSLVLKTKFQKKGEMLYNLKLEIYRITVEVFILKYRKSLCIYINGSQVIVHSFEHSKCSCS